MRQAQTAALFALLVGVCILPATAPPPHLAPPTELCPPAAVLPMPSLPEGSATREPEPAAGQDDDHLIAVAALELLPPPSPIEDTPSPETAKGACKQCTAAPPERLPPPELVRSTAPPSPVVAPAKDCSCCCEQCNAEPIHEGHPEPIHEGQRDSIRLWGSAEYLVWWFKNSPEQAPLAATRSLALGGAVTFGGRDIDTGEHNGGRFTLGGWFCESQTAGAEVSYFFLGSKGANPSRITGPGEVFPYVDPRLGPTGVTFVDPTLDSARETLTLSQFLQGCTVNGVANVLAWERLRLDALGGVRYLDFSEDLGFLINLNGVPGGRAPGFLGSYADQFNARNQFFGGNLGLRGEARWRGWFINGTAQLGVGDCHERLSIAGTSAQSGGAAAFLLTGTFPGQGVFAQQTNGGVTVRDRFAVLPEGTFNVGYEFNSHLRAMVGYSFLYLSDVVRPGAQLNPTINTSNVPFFGNGSGPLVGPTLPGNPGRSSDFWGQGVSVGLELRY